MPLLSARWALLDVDDVEALAVYAIRRSRHVGELRVHEREDLCAFVIASIWECSRDFDPDRGRFSTFATVVAQRRVVDWLRQRDGRTRWQFHDHVYERERPQFVSLNDRLDEALSSRAGDSTADRLEDERGLYTERDRTRATDDALLGLRPSRRAA